MKRQSNLEGMLVTLRLSEFFQDVSKLRNGSLVPFADPPLNNVSCATFWQTNSEDSGFEIILSIRIRSLFVEAFVLRRSRREKS